MLRACEIFENTDDSQRLTHLFWRSGPINSFGPRRGPIRIQEMTNIFEYISITITLNSLGPTVFDDEDLRVLDREEGWFGFSTQT